MDILGKPAVYKVHIFDATGAVKRIHIFCGGSKNESHLPELFSEIELALHKTNAAEYVFSDQWIHYDDSIRTIKKKIVQEIGADKVSYKEIYLFGFFDSRVDMKEIYNEITENESTELTNAKMTQIALNINANQNSISKLDLEQDIYSYDDFMELQPEGGRAYVNKPIGIKFHSNYDFLFSANPFHINSLHPTVFEISPKNQLLAFENHLVLSYGNMESNNIFVCLAETVFDFASANGVEHEQMSELYYPGLYVDGIHVKDDLIKERPALLKETAASLNPKFYKTVDMFHEIYWNRTEELAYLERGISKYSVTMRSSNEDHPFPLDVLFKNIHSTKEMPFIKYNPGKNRENMYRLFSEKLAKNGKKIPALKESVIMKLKRELGKSNMISIYLLREYNKRNYTVNIHFDSNAKIRMEGELYPPLLKGDLEEFLKTAINPVIQMLKNYLYSSGYVINTFKTLSDENIEAENFKYVAVYPIEKTVDLTKMIGCINSVFDVITKDVKTGANLRFKRVENFKEMEAQDALIMETYKRTNDPMEVVTALMEAYQLSEQEAELRFAQYSSTHTQLNGKFLENPGFPVSMKMVPFKNDIVVEIDEITSIEYIQVLHVYIDSILRNSQGLINNAELAAKVNDICSKAAKAVEVKDKFGEDAVITSNEASAVFKIQPLQFGKEEEVLDDDDDVRGIYFDDDEYDYEAAEQEQEDEEQEEQEEEEQMGGDLRGGNLKGGEQSETYAPDIDGTSLKYPNLFQRKLSERDPSLFLTEKQGKYKLYSRTCPLKRQPVILTDAEKKKIDETSPGSYEHAVQYGSDPQNPYWYICPRYWCLKTNTSITEEEVKSGKCGNIIPSGATTVPKGAYVYEFTDKDHIDSNGKYQKHVPSFLDSSLHPDGLCIPCCFKKSWDSKQHRDLRAKCAQDGKAAPKAPVEGEPKFNPHIMSSVTSPLDQYRWAFLPMALQYFLGTDNSLAVDKKKPSQVKPGATALLRYGIEKHDRQSFLGCIAHYYAHKHNLEKTPSIKEMRDILAKSITLDMFLKYHNGNLVNIFRPPIIDQKDVDIDKHIGSEFAKTIDLNNEAQLDFLEETISSYDAFIKYLTDDASEIDYTYLWDVISDRNPKLMRDGLNLVILDLVNSDGTDNVHLVCPSTSYSSVTHNPSKETAIIMKSGEYYDPIQSYHLQTTVDLLVKKTFMENDAMKNVKHMLELIKQSTKKYCHPLASQPKVYKFDQNISARDLFVILKSYKFNVGSQIINYNKKVIGLCVNKEEGQNFLYVPCFPSGILDSIKIRYIDDDGLWLDYVTTRDRLIGLHNDTDGKVKCLPKVKIMEDKLVVGFLTRTNQFIQISPPAENIHADGLEVIEHFDYPIKKGVASVDKTLALVKTGDQARIQAIHNISVESDFYNVFRSVIRMELNDYDNRAIKRQITEILDNGGILYGTKLVKIDALLRQLTKDAVSFQNFDQKTIDSFRNISICQAGESCGKKQYCLASETGCKTIFPKLHLVSRVDNEKVYYGRMADELVRYRRIRTFMFQTKSYLNISYAEYQIDGKEMFILDSLLTKDYFKDLVPYNTNQYITNIQYDDAQPEITRNYDNTVSLSEQFALIQTDEKSGDLEDYISTCIKETAPRVIGNDKVGSWRVFFPTNAKEIVFENTIVCSYIPVIYILQKVLKTPISIQNVKTTLWNGYSKLMELHRDKILALLRAHGKRHLIDLVLTKKSTLEHVIFSDEYYLTDLDLWIICKTAELPVVLFSSTKLKFLNGGTDWLRLDKGRGNPNEKYYFIRSPAAVSVNQPPAYQLVSQPYSFSELKNDMFIKADRGDTEYSENMMTVDTFLSKYHVISRPK